MMASVLVDDQVLPGNDENDGMDFVSTLETSISTVLVS